MPDTERDESAIPEIDLQITSVLESMAPVYRYNVEDQLLMMLSRQISQEIDQEILRSLVDYA